MTFRAQASGIRLTAEDAAIVKGMLARRDRQHDIAAWFGVNPGRVNEIAKGHAWKSVRVRTANLPPPGPYPAMRDLYKMLSAVRVAKAALEECENLATEELDNT